MASILSKSRRSPESLPHGWATSSPPRGMETNRAGREAVSRRWRSQKQSPCCVRPSSLPQCPLPTQDTEGSTCCTVPRENPARPPAAGHAEVPSHVGVSICIRHSLSGRANQRRPATPRTSLGLRHKLWQVPTVPPERGQPTGRASPPGVPVAGCLLLFPDESTLIICLAS